MTDKFSDEDASVKKFQFTTRTLLKITAWSAVLIYFVWKSWDRLGFVVLASFLLLPFMFIPEMIDWLLGAKRDRNRQK